jgi:hypothetical protein
LRLTAAVVGFFPESVDLRGISCSMWRQLEVDTLLRVVGLDAVHCSSVSVHRFSQKAVQVYGASSDDKQCYGTRTKYNWNDRTTTMFYVPCPYLHVSLQEGSAAQCHMSFLHQTECLHYEAIVSGSFAYLRHYSYSEHMLCCAGIERCSNIACSSDHMCTSSAVESNLSVPMCHHLVLESSDFSSWRRWAWLEER